ncbi:DUF2254 domain-containing protein [Deinococcus sedimenti]|uniref:DUF2254 domain-containing protein n=1 Tax=Deinococcus sedimenti TaxID=1867090 RepID=A0ABQ2S842_9DEIO|nr:DUF2254 domain-containing protein [Deinococcus sedimenti]GGS04017.1 hypothetical protein GCM10008960_33330 [Deinococcus sedimenti]
MTRFWLRVSEWTGQFWFLPAVMTLGTLLLAWAGIQLEEQFGVPVGLTWVYSGGESGARSLLSAVASSSIGVAGTVFSITIAALSYAAGSMGPRLLDNFTRDRGNQAVLGTFIATFAFTLFSLRSVQGSEDNPFVPHYNVTVAMGLALCCVAALVYFLAHVTRSINMTAVVNLLRDDLRRALDRATQEKSTDTAVTAPPEAFWAGGEVLRSPDSGYLQLLDTGALIASAEREGVALRIVVRPGDYVFPNTPVAVGVPHLPDRVLPALTLGPRRVAGQDLEFTVRQLAEVAARALSPGVNDPVTATDVIDRFGDALCRLQGRTWPPGVEYRDHQLRLVYPVTTYAGLLDSMFHLIRQYGRGSPAVTLRLLDVLRIVAEGEPDPARRRELRRHADLTIEDARANTGNSGDRSDLEARYHAFLRGSWSAQEEEP